MAPSRDNSAPTVANHEADEEGGGVDVSVLHASAAELGKDAPLAHRRQGQAYTLENRARGIEIRLGLPRG